MCKHRSHVRYLASPTTSHNYQWKPYLLNGSGKVRAKSRLSQLGLERKAPPPLSLQVYLAKKAQAKGDGAPEGEKAGEAE